MTTRILLVDDDPTILDTFPVYFSTTDDLKVSGTARTGRQALTWLDTNTCDLVLSDVRMPDIDGIELLQHIQDFNRPPLFVAMTAFDTDDTMLKCLGLGAVGYIIKGQAPESIIHSLRDATHGGTVLSPGCLNRLLDSKTVVNREDGSEFRAPKINNREQVVLSLICEGKTNGEIGKSLRLAEVTVRKVIANLFIKFSARNRVDLAVRYQTCKDSHQGTALRLPSENIGT
ncbi:response regulator [Corynebacterium sp. HMSC28B08]|uniref:response regulator n=1 Tax=Corynebacterium TaxID=1716 RepID=UPI0008A6279A|nr:response regulator transcription factor [Corynebacterium sp. HMSC28B08]OFT91600.1 DNA-binding response regulator [Corynebacterium sp. HMSC28B08]